MAPTEPRSGAAPDLVGPTVLYRERVGVPLGIWAVVVFVTASLGIAYAFATTWWIGLLAFAGTTALAAWGLAGTALQVVVDDAEVQVGRARLPLRHVGGVEALDAEATRVLRGPGADVRAHLALRPFVETGVRLDLDDPRDPHPYWLVSTRRPEAFAAAVRAAADGAGRAG